MTKIQVSDAVAKFEATLWDFYIDLRKNLFF